MPSATLQPQPAETTQPQRCTFYVYCMQKNHPTRKHSVSPRLLGITTLYLLTVEVSQSTPLCCQSSTQGTVGTPVSGPYTLVITLSSLNNHAAWEAEIAKIKEYAALNARAIILVIAAASMGRSVSKG